MQSALIGASAYGCGLGVLSSTNRGQTWAPVGSGLSANAIVLVLGISRNTLYAGIQGGRIYTTASPRPAR